MRYIYNLKSLPRSVPPIQLQQLDEAADRLVRKLKAIDVKTLPISDFGKESIYGVKKMVDEIMKKYVHILAWLLAEGRDWKQDTFIDYGGGHGVLACLAKEIGFSKVVYDDIFYQCCEDARRFGEYIGCPADKYICGDIHAVHAALAAENVPSCALVSINVIEHIYDMNEFIEVAASLSKGPMSMVLSTSANPLNPIVRSRHFKQHREWEFKDGPHEGSYPMDSLKAFRTIRKDLVKEAAPDLSSAEVDRLADATRGLNKTDVLKCVEDYNKTKIISVSPDHPTNTCDPITGSWQERLLDIPSVSRTLEKEHFKVTVLGGYYSGTANNPLVRRVKEVLAIGLNHGISALGRQGPRLSPCFMFRAIRD